MPDDDELDVADAATPEELPVAADDELAADADEADEALEATWALEAAGPAPPVPGGPKPNVG